jgi:hypothetical protein
VIAVAASLPAPRQPLAVPPITRGYVLHLLAKLLEAEAGLVAMNEKYGQVKARFDRCYARRGITPKSDIVSYQNVKAQNPELRFWYSKVEHFQREVAAYGTALTGLEAARRMLGSDGYRVGVENGSSRDSRRGLYRAS